MSNGSKRWKPDDSFHDIVKGKYKGVRRVENALRKYGLDIGDKIITSRDTGMDALHKALKRSNMPKGFEQWQMPTILGGDDRPVMPFISVGQPNAIVPKHVHKNDCLLRIVLSGSIIHGKTELTSGDWVYVPQGHPYSFSAGKFGCVILHLYNGTGLYTKKSHRPAI